VNGHDPTTLRRSDAPSDLELYRRANRYLDEGMIRPVAPQRPARPPLSRRQWMEWFLPRLGDPQRAFPAIHVAGTSGKGSVAMFIAEILRAARVRAGLHVSPYVQVSTEKLWVDGLYASAVELAELVEWIRPHAEACRGPEVPLHGIASVALVLEHFRRAGVEVAVVETGVGGRHDLTAVLRTEVAVISAVGFDHQRSLGETLEEIAWHKAGIIRPGGRAVALAGPGAAAAAAEARALDASLRLLDGDSFRCVDDEDGGTLLDYRGARLRLHGARLGMPGRFQAANAALALAAVEEWDRGGRVDEGAARLGLARARLPARLERMPSRRAAVMLDGAHNPDKLAALLGALPALGGRRVHVVYGAVAGREPDESVRRLAASADTFVATEPRVYAKPSRPAAEVAHLVSGVARGALLVEPDPRVALERALAAARPEDVLLATGSLYLCGELRDLWYPEEAVLEGRHSFPEPGRTGDHGRSSREEAK
jgi:dihydrofolate synthase/folylpolyglutamate synthase